jgi:hypothetical protein
VGACLEIGAGGDVVAERGAGDEERAHGRETDEVEGRHGAAGSAEEHQHATGLEALERLIEGGFAHRVIDDGKAFAVGDALYLVDEVLLGVEDHLVGAGAAGEGGLLFGGDGGDDPGATLFGHLGEEQPGATGSGVDQHGFAGLDGVGGVGEVVGGHALEEGGGRLVGGDAIGHADKLGDGGDGLLGVGSANATPGNTVAHLEGGDIGAEGDYGSRSLLAGDEGQLGGIAALAEVGVDEVHARGLDGDEGLTRCGDRGGKLEIFEDVRTASLFDLNCVHD